MQSRIHPSPDAAPRAQFAPRDGRDFRKFRNSGNVWKQSMGWLKGKSTGNHRFSLEIWDFPVFCSLKPINWNKDGTFRYYGHHMFFQLPRFEKHMFLGLLMAAEIVILGSKCGYPPIKDQAWSRVQCTSVRFFWVGPLTYLTLQWAGEILHQQDISARQFFLKGRHTEPGSWFKLIAQISNISTNYVPVTKTYQPTIPITNISTINQSSKVWLNNCTLKTSHQQG